MSVSVKLAVVIAAGVVLGSCAPPKPPILETGRWTGTVMPMDHPDQRAEVYYRVAYAGEDLTIIVGQAGTESSTAREIELTADTLKFAFEEPEADVLLRCAFGLQSNGSYEGLCNGPEGKAAYYIMRLPDRSVGMEA